MNTTKSPVRITEGSWLLLHNGYVVGPVAAAAALETPSVAKGG